MRLCLLLLPLLLAQAAHAQDEAPPSALPAPPLVEASTEPTPPPVDSPADPSIELGKGDKLIVHMPQGLRYTGELLSLMPGELTLKLQTQQVVNLLVSDVERLEIGERRWARVGLVGGGIGALSGTLVVGFFCLIASTEGPIDIPSCAGGGALLGASVGAVLGAVAGLATVSWSTLYSKQEDGPLSLRMEDPNLMARLISGTGRRGELGLQLGYARDVGISQPTDGWGGRLHLLLLLGPYFAIGPEFAVYKDVGDDVQVIGDGQTFPRERYLVQFQGLVRAGGQVGPVRVGLLGGAGVHANRNSHFGGMVGVETELRPWEHLPPLAVDVRYHINLDKNPFADRQDFLTIGLGSRVRW
jgi:hypothetical protein